MSTHGVWANYETWNINLWLSNDEGLYYGALELARECVDASTEGGAQAPCATAFAEWVDELCELICPGSREGASFVSDILGMALREVDWYEIADVWIGKVAEEVES